MINGIQLSFFSNYIYNPKRWLHSLLVRNKILMMGIYIISIPYCSLSMFGSLTILISFIFISLANKNDSIYIYNILLALTIYCLFLLIITNISYIPSDYLFITVPYQVKVKLFHKKIMRTIKYNNRITIFISRVITRSLLLLISYYLSYQLIIFTTQLEELLMYYIDILHYMSKDISIVSITDLLFIIILSYDYICLIEKKIQNITISLNIRGQSFSLFSNYYEFFKILILIVKLIERQLKQDILNTKNVIYTRELNMSTKHKWLIH